MTQLDWQRASTDEDEGAGAYLEVAAGPDGQIYMRESNDPETVVVTTQAKWDAFLKGVKAGEFDDFAEEAGEDVAESAAEAVTEE
ncbi:DUF397 domain-containing protein [Streptomyces himastatinicus]|nr:DUF397 domain-containing protein [Streptomyces himastatinicus]